MCSIHEAGKLVGKTKHTFMPRPIDHSRCAMLLPDYIYSTDLPWPFMEPNVILQESTQRTLDRHHDARTRTLITVYKVTFG